jgi:hypothetical protein
MILYNVKAKKTQKVHVFLQYAKNKKTKNSWKKTWGTKKKVKATTQEISN